ncbi:MAG: hypothetical protein R3D88_07530 [Alphaproteobacteria bacterium]
MSDKKPWELPEYESVIDRVKHRDVWGPMRPKLFGVVDSSGETLSKLRLQWMYYAGMGDVALDNLKSDNEKIILDYLIDQGIVVPTHIEDHYGICDIQNYQHFDDVNWAYVKGDQIAIYRLSQNPYFPDAEDELISTNEQHEKAIAHLTHLFKMGSAMVDDPITLKSGEQIIPIITGREQVALRQRQQGIFPVDLPESKHRQDQPKI